MNRQEFIEHYQIPEPGDEFVADLDDVIIQAVKDERERCVKVVRNLSANMPEKGTPDEVSQRDLMNDWLLKALEA